MQHLSCVRSSAGRRRRVWITFMVLLVVVASLITAAIAIAGSHRIVDPDATPNFTADINGSGASVDAAMSVVADGTGAYVAGWAGNVAGNADATLARVTSRGAVKWLKRYDGPAHMGDAFAKIVKGPGGTIYAAGWTMAANNKTNLLVVKWSSSGGKVWTKTYDGPSHGNDSGVSLGVDKAGSVTVVGSSDGANGTDFVVVKWSASGARQFVWRYDGSARDDDAATDVVVASDGTTYATGNVKTAGPRDAVLTVKFKPSGGKAWQRVYLGTNSLGAGASSATPRPGGGVYVAGWTQVAVGNKDGLVLRYGATGSAQVLPPYAAPGDQGFSDVTVTTTRTVAAVGGDAQPGNMQNHVRWWTSETAPSAGGSTGGAWDDAYTAVAADSLGAFCFTGWQRTAATASQMLSYRLRILGTTNSGFRAVWNLGANYNNGYAVAANGTTVYVAGSGYKDAAETYNQTIVIYIY
jgi:hypothetical protein